MKNILMCSIALAMSCNTSQKTVAETAKAPSPIVSSSVYAETITEAELKEHLYVYASDEYEGRETGTPGQKKAIAYIKSQYEKLGIPAAKTDGDYFQNVPLEISKIPSGSVVLNGTEYLVGEHIVSFSQATTSLESIVYVGFGIEDGDHSDYKGINVTDKYVLVKAGEPINEDGTYKLSGTATKSVWSNISESLSKRISLAKDKGAKGILYYDQTNYPRFKSRFNHMKGADNGNMSLKENASNKFASLFIDAEFAKSILPEVDTDNIRKVVPAKIDLKVESTNNEVNSENVAAILKGSEKPNEYVVISSHLDHIGVNADGEINNGADDDGSGTVALIEIAEAFKKAAEAGNGPKRSILFLHVTGEEKGLLGSQYYTDVDPIVPLANTVANLNIDMIGRIDPKREGDRNYIYLIGSDKLSTDLHALSEEVNSKYMNIELDYTYNDENDPNRFYYRSDHYNFAKNNIPIIFYFNGTHDDYHKPTDTPDKINYDLLMNRSQLIFHTAWEVANRDQRVVVDKESK
ncbi:MAG: M28 family peptidase [Maribacter sp.]